MPDEDKTTSDEHVSPDAIDEAFEAAEVPVEDEEVDPLRPKTEEDEDDPIKDFMPDDEDDNY